jgi:hypothetical protein
MMSLMLELNFSEARASRYTDFVIPMTKIGLRMDSQKPIATAR